MPRLTTQLALILAVVILAAFIVFAGPAACNKMRSLGAQSKVDRAQGEAQRNSAGDAVNTVTSVGQNAAASEDMTRGNERDIRKAPGAGERVNSGVDAAGRAALCKRQAYVNDPRCSPFRRQP